MLHVTGQALLFPSPLGDYFFNTVVTIADLAEEYGLEFPSPSGDYFFNMTTAKKQNNEKSTQVSVPIRGLFFLTGEMTQEEVYRHTTLFPSPLGDYFLPGYDNQPVW